MRTEKLAHFKSFKTLCISLGNATLYLLTFLVRGNVHGFFHYQIKRKGDSIRIYTEVICMSRIMSMLYQLIHICLYILPNITLLSLVRMRMPLIRKCQRRVSKIQTYVRRCNVDTYEITQPKMV